MVAVAVGDITVTNPSTGFACSAGGEEVVGCDTVSSTKTLFLNIQVSTCPNQCTCNAEGGGKMSELFGSCSGFGDGSVEWIKVANTTNCLGTEDYVIRNAVRGCIVLFEINGADNSSMSFQYNAASNSDITNYLGDLKCSGLDDPASLTLRDTLHCTALSSHKAGESLTFTFMAELLYGKNVTFLSEVGGTVHSADWAPKATPFNLSFDYQIQAEPTDVLKLKYSFASDVSVTLWDGKGEFLKPPVLPPDENSVLKCNMTELTCFVTAYDGVGVVRAVPADFTISHEFVNTTNSDNNCAVHDIIVEVLPYSDASFEMAIGHQGTCEFINVAIELNVSVNGQLLLTEQEDGSYSHAPLVLRVPGKTTPIPPTPQPTEAPPTDEPPPPPPTPNPPPATPYPMRTVAPIPTDSPTEKDKNSILIILGAIAGVLVLFVGLCALGRFLTKQRTKTAEIQTFCVLGYDGEHPPKRQFSTPLIEEGPTDELQDKSPQQAEPEFAPDFEEEEDDGTNNTPEPKEEIASIQEAETDAFVPNGDEIEVME